MMPQSSEDKFWMRVEKRQPDECWKWKGPISKKGYGVFNYGKNVVGAHRVHFLMNGLIHKDMVVDHVCRNRACVNPRHLRLVTHRQNAIENSVSFSAVNAAKKKCVRGHALVGESVRIRDSAKGPIRECLVCKRIRQEERNAQRTASRKARKVAWKKGKWRS